MQFYRMAYYGTRTNDAMEILIRRYYGNETETKSTMRVSRNGQCELACEAREPQFASYREAFPGCSRCCVAEGTYRGTLKPTEFSPLTLTFQSPGHKGTRVCWTDMAQHQMNRILIGESDGDEIPEERQITNQRQTYEKLQQLLYQAFEL